MSTLITTALLHQHGWQSYVNDDEMYFEFENLHLLYDPENKNWGIAGENDTITTWEELLVIYKRMKGKDFVAGTPVEDNLQFKFIE